MHVGAKQEPVADAVRSTVGHRPNVRGVKDRQSFLSRHRAPAFVRVGDEDSERALPQPLPGWDDPPQDRPFRLRDCRCLSETITLEDSLPELSASIRFEIVGLALDYVGTEISRSWYPIVVTEKEGLLQNDATDRVLCVQIDLRAAILLDTSAHLW